MAASSLALAGRTSAERPGIAWSTSAASATSSSSGSVTWWAVPCAMTERKLTEWLNADLVSTSASTRVTVRQTGRPWSVEALRSGRLPVEPWTYSRPPTRA